MESSEVQITIERIEENNNIVIVYPSTSCSTSTSGNSTSVCYYIVKSPQWESELKHLFAPGQTVSVQLETIKDHLAITSVAGIETSSKGARRKLPKFVTQFRKAQERERIRLEAEACKASFLEEYKETFGFRPLVEPEPRTPEERRQYTEIGVLGEAHVGQRVWIRGRIHNSRHNKGLLFVVLRQRHSAIQVVIAKPTELIEFAKGLSNESVVDIYGEVALPASPLRLHTLQSVEVQVEKLFVLSQAIPKLPLEIEAATRPGHVIQARTKEIEELEKRIAEQEAKVAAGEKEEDAQKELEDLLQRRKDLKPYSKVGQVVRLDNRVLEIRTTTNQAIFMVQAGVCRLFREILMSEGFMEIHTPKLISAASEGGAQVFKTDYFEKKGIPHAYLAQSPQWYKQMAVVGDFGRVFEIGPVFRREDSNTHRHLTEFVGLDLEMTIKQHYHEVLEMLDRLMIGLFKGLETHYAKELKIINQQYPVEPLQYLEPKSLRLVWTEAIPMIQEELRKPVEETLDPVLVAALLKELAKDKKKNVGDLDDLSTTAEKLLGKLVKARYHTDFFILDKFPTHIRPFYTMPSSENEVFSNAFDMFLRGEEICSGAQRIHELELLKQRALESKVELASIQSYLDSFSFGAEPHGGAGLGLERVVMFYLGLNNIRKTSMFPRDPQRITP